MMYLSQELRSKDQQLRAKWQFDFKMRILKTLKKFGWKADSSKIVKVI